MQPDSPTQAKNKSAMGGYNTFFDKKRNSHDTHIINGDKEQIKIGMREINDRASRDYTAKKSDMLISSVDKSDRDGTKLPSFRKRMNEGKQSADEYAVKLGSRNLSMASLNERAQGSKQSLLGIQSSKKRIQGSQRDSNERGSSHAIMTNRSIAKERVNNSSSIFSEDMNYSKMKNSQNSKNALGGSSPNHLQAFMKWKTKRMEDEREKPDIL